MINEACLSDNLVDGSYNWLLAGAAELHDVANYTYSSLSVIQTTTQSVHDLETISYK